jgi:hypothetical protein
VSQKSKRERWKERAEAERAEGLSPDDAATRWIEDADAGRGYRVLSTSAAAWRSGAVTEAQRRMMRRLGLNPFLVSTRGAASDAIEAAKKKNRREA